MHDVYETRVGKRWIRLAERCLPLTLVHSTRFLCLSVLSERAVLQQLSSVQIHYKGDLKSSQGCEQVWVFDQIKSENLFTWSVCWGNLDGPEAEERSGHVISQSERLHDSQRLSTPTLAGTSAEKHVPQCFVNKESGTRNWERCERYAAWSAWLRIFSAVWWGSEIGAWSMSINHQKFISMIWKLVLANLIPWVITSSPLFSLTILHTSMGSPFHKSGGLGLDHQIRKVQNIQSNICDFRKAAATRPIRKGIDLEMALLLRFVRHSWNAIPLEKTQDARCCREFCHL